MRNWILTNWQYRLIALVLALFSWYLVAGREKIESWVEVPVELINIPEGLTIVDGLVNTIEVRVRGTKGPVRSIKERQLAYTLNLRGLKKGTNLVSFDPEIIPISGAIEVMEIRPQRVNLMVDELISKKLPVRMVWEGTVHPDYELVRISANPGFVTLKGPQSQVEQFKAVPSQPFAVPEELSETWQDVVLLDVGQDLEVVPDEVTARFFVKPKLQNLWLELPVILSPPQSQMVELLQNRIRVHVELPVTFIKEEDWRSRLKVILKAAPGLSPGRHELEPELSLPRWGQVLEFKPERVPVTVIEKNSNATSAP